MAIAAAPNIPPGAPEARGVASVPAERAAGNMSAVFDRIRRAASTEDWRRDGWNEPAISEVLGDLVEQVSQAAGVEALALPARIGNVRPVAFEPRRGLNSSLWVGKNVRVGFAQSSVILADGNLNIDFATDCLIVARGAVEIAHGGGNVVVAGHYINVAHDGSQAGVRADAGGSLLVSGGVIDVSHATGTVCSAPQLVRISHANGVRLINSPREKITHAQNCVRVAGAKLPLAPPAKENPLEGKLRLTQVVHSDEREQRFVTLMRDGVEMLVRPGREVRGGTGKPVPELAGWTLSFVCEDYALFTKDGEDAGFMVPDQRQ
jgi:hypothetical protein